MVRKVLGSGLLLAAASSAWGYQVSAIQANAGFLLDESDAQQIVAVRVEREFTDVPGTCTVDVTAQTGDFGNPPPNMATAGVDYTPTTGNVRITITDTDSFVDATFVVPVADDTEQEPTEDFAASVASVTPVSCDPSAVFNINLENAVSIFDDDTPPEWVFANEPFQAAETDGTATITLMRQGGTSGALTVFYRAEEGSAVDGTDFSSVSGSVTWADGQGGPRTFAVPVLDDGALESDETVLIRAGTDSDFVQFEQTTLTIRDDDTPASTGFSTTDVSAAEGDDSVVLTLVRGGGSVGTVSVDYATQDGTAVAGEDYVATAGTITWTDGDVADKTITVQLLDDGDSEDAEEFQVVLSNVTGNASLGGNITIAVTIDASDPSREVSDIPTLTLNQQQLANWFDDTCPRLEGLAAPTGDEQDLVNLCSVVRSPDSDDAAVQQALDAINPEELLVSSFNALKLTSVQHGNLSQRLNALRTGARGIDLAGLDLSINGQSVAGAALQEMFNSLTGGNASAEESPWGRWGGFLNGRIATGDKDATDNESGFDFDLYGITAGIDYRIRDNFIVGVSGGWGSVDSDYAADAGTLDIDSWNVAAYLTYFRDQKFYVDALATYGRNDYDSTRHILFGEGDTLVDRTGRGRTDGRQLSAGFGTGWDFNRSAFTFGPHVGAYVLDVDVDGFSETGAGGLDVVVDDQSTQSFTVNAGGHLSYAWLTGWGVLVPNVKLDWVHEFKNGSEALAFRFVNDPFAGDPSDPSPTITLRSDRPDPNYLIWSAGVSAQFVYGLSGFVSYQSYAAYDSVEMGEWTMGARWEKTW